MRSPWLPSITIDVLANDSGDMDPATLTIVKHWPKHGTATPTGGVVVYQPQPGRHGGDHFHYQVCGPAGCASAKVKIKIDKNPAQTASVPLPLLLGGSALMNAVLRRRRTR